VNRDEIIGAYRSTGAVFFKGFGADLDQFEKLTTSLTQNLLTNRGAAFSFGPFKRSTVNQDPTLLTATGNRQDFALPLHGEFYYFRFPPQLIWFYCDCPASTGGETTISDGAAIMSAFTQTTRDMLRNRRIKYQRELDAGEWQVAFQTDSKEAVEAICNNNDAQYQWGDDGSLSTEYRCYAYIHDGSGREIFINDLLPVALGEIVITKGEVAEMRGMKPPLVVRWEDGSPLGKDILDEIVEVAYKSEIPVRADAGDILMIDNTRILHGRRGSTSAERRVLVRMGSPRF
jgi:alpha-ketoglutarate-dependent taurine dioxygenase